MDSYENVQNQLTEAICQVKTKSPLVFLRSKLDNHQGFRPAPYTISESMVDLEKTLILGPKPKGDKLFDISGPFP